jgi:hypothetical protein
MRHFDDRTYVVYVDKNSNEVFHCHIIELDKRKKKLFDRIRDYLFGE